MKRWIPKIAICLLLGLITTVAIAWASGAWLRIRAMDEYAAGRTTQDDSGWFLRAYKRPGAQFVIGYLISDVTDYWPGDEWREDYLSPDEIDWPNVFEQSMDPRLETERTIKMNARGWPWPCLYLDMFEARSSNQLNYDGLTVNGGVYWKTTLPNNVLFVADSLYAVMPWQPIWSGLLLDIAIFGGFWAIIFSFGSFIRKRWRCLTRKHTLIALLTSILLGVVSTIAVVWYCANWVDENLTNDIGEDGYGESFSKDHYASWTVYRNVEPGALRLRSYWSAPKRAGIAYSGAPVDGPVEDFIPYWTDYLSPGDDDKIHRILDARGWPMLAMWGGFEYTQQIDSNHYVVTLGETKNAIVRPRLNLGEFSPYTSRVIPLAPIWFGFAVDTLFYAVIWLFFLYLLAGPGIIKRSIRHKRGLCIKCGYDLRGTDHNKCPECGWGREDEG